MESHRPEWNALNSLPADSPPDKPPKRRKVAIDAGAFGLHGLALLSGKLIACDECRVRKTKCDGVQPVCGPCAKRSDAGVQCTYGTGRQRRSGFSKDYVSSLETRIKDLERGNGPSNHQSTFAVPTNGASSRPYDPIEVRSSSTSGHYQGPSTQFSPKSAPPSAYPRSFSLSEERYQNAFTPIASSPSVADRAPRETKGVNAMMGAVDEPQGHGYFGTSSAANFLQQIKTAVDAKVVSPEGRPSGMVLNKVQLSTLPSEPRQKSNNADYVLPPRKTADALLDVYWRLVHPLYPFLDRYEISYAYQKLWTGEQTEFDETLLMCTLNIMFALACQLSDTIEPEQRGASADVFFQRAKELLNFDLWHVGSIQLIQCLLIMGQYLQSTNSAHECWIVVGLAVRNAQSLGLHLPQTDAQFRNSREKELARRIWHGCVLMDRIVSMTFGRPVMITQRSADAVPLPAAIDDEYLSDDPQLPSSQPRDRPSILAFFGKTLELYKIMTKILLTLYTPVDDESRTDAYQFYFGEATSEGISNLFALDQSLTQWARTLPPHLRADASESGMDVNLNRQSKVLRARFLHIRMLLFRPILSRYCVSQDPPTSYPASRTSLEDTLPQRIALQCSILCIHVAQEFIALIHTNIPTDGSLGPLPAWWYNILYTYTAATILVAARLRPNLTSEVSEEAITHSWNCALEILRKYQKYSTSAQRCIAALEILYNRVPRDGVPVRPPPRDGVSLLADAASQRRPADLNNKDFGGSSLGFQLLGAAAEATSGISAVEGEGPPPQGQEDSGLGNAWFDSLGFLDLGDMSWLNIVPSNL